MYHIFFIHSLVVGHLSCFQFLALTNNAVMSTVEQMFLWYSMHPLGMCPRVVMLPLVVDWFTIFWEAAILNPNCLYNFALPEAMEECSPILHPLQHKLSSMFLILAILIGVRCYCRVVLICISLMLCNLFFYMLTAEVCQYLLLKISFFFVV